MSIFKKKNITSQSNIQPSLFESNKEFKALLSQILPFKPKNLELYKRAITHASFSDEDACHNERLEFLGDAFLGSVVGELLYLKYPKKDEGFLTEMRSKIVSRQNLNKLATNIGLNKIVRYNKNDAILTHSHIFGNALEALIGAIYLDKGYKTTRNFIIATLVKDHVDLDVLETTETNFKKGLYQWAQKLNKKLEFIDLETTQSNKRKVFSVGIYIDGVYIVNGTGWNKKEASQKAAENALQIIHAENPENEDNQC